VELAAVNVRNAWVTILGVSLAAVALLVWVIYIKEQPANTEDVLPFLPLLNCLFNGLSGCCLVGGFLAIRKGNRKTHMRWMVGAFICSTVFLVSYLLHHHLHGDTKFPTDNALRWLYYPILASHIVLSIVCLPMILMTFFLSLSGRIPGHRRIAKYTFPIWLYVSVTGVLVFALQKGVGL